MYDNGQAMDGTLTDLAVTHFSFYPLAAHSLLPPLM